MSQAEYRITLEVVVTADERAEWDAVAEAVRSRVGRIGRRGNGFFPVKGDHLAQVTRVRVDTATDQTEMER